jgi:hypothetical protein
VTLRALAYARFGWLVLPLRGKRPLTMHGVHDASSDPEQIARWWRGHLDANIGVACGAASGIDVIDVDGEAGRATLADLEATQGALPATPRQVTGSGGLHVVFAYDRRVRSATACAACRASIRAPTAATSSSARASTPVAGFIAGTRNCTR